jgi:dihydropteroate synthase
MPFDLATTAKRPLIMGIINVTPDSFSGDGLMAQRDPVAAALEQAMRMVEEGADVLDIGGESSKPGAAPISADEEISRIVPVIRAIRQKTPIALSIDTVKAAVAVAAMDAGADIINDISALAHDADMARLAAQRKATVVLMHNSSRANAVAHDAKLGGEYEAADGGDIIETVKRDLRIRVAAAKQAGIADDKIILDPGLGFGKTVAQHLTLMNRLHEIAALGYPLMVGPSRKSFIGRVLDTPVDERLEGTAALVAASILQGAAIIRVHDVQFMARVAKMAAAIGAG